MFLLFAISFNLLFSYLVKKSKNSFYNNLILCRVIIYFIVDLDQYFNIVVYKNILNTLGILS